MQICKYRYQISISYHRQLDKNIKFIQLCSQLNQTLIYFYLHKKPNTKIFYRTSQYISKHWVRGETCGEDVESDGEHDHGGPQPVQDVDGPVSVQQRPLRHRHPLQVSRGRGHGVVTPAVCCRRVYPHQALPQRITLPVQQPR